MLHCNPEFLHVVRPKTPRGDGNLKPCCTATRNSCTSSDPKPREGTETFCLMLGRQLLTKSSDPKPREGTETRKRRASSDRLLVVRPKTPRGDGNNTSVARHTPTNHQVVRPKTPRGDGNNTSVARHTPTNHQVVRPKTPRGDGNTNASSFPASISACRQTQNPERGRKHGISAARPGRCCPRSSDPKPREGTETSSTIIAIPSPHVSSDPKPREGTETCANPFGVMRMVGSGRQTQNPERGRKP
ncbi:hypothetical protein V739_04043 [Mycobacterium tuberculosis 51628]|nr:hypothetical protein V739_04043 [Mycobacterium tuberculosis 51628]